MTPLRSGYCRPSSVSDIDHKYYSRNTANIITLFSLVWKIAKLSTSQFNPLVVARLPLNDHISNIITH